jgi:ABC-type lipoprotein release transport system permease subunit
MDKFGANLNQGRQTAVTSQSLTPAIRARRVPAVLAGILALMAVAMLAHTLLSSIRRRRRDLAILKTLGFTRGQISASVAWQSSTLVALSLLIGVPLGAAIGRWAWNLFADQLGVIPEAVIPIGLVLLIVPGAILLANVIGFLPGLSAGRTKPSIVLRAE